MTETIPGRPPLPSVPGLTDLSFFARGGYATVYRATQVSVGREVAVKVENRTLDSERDQQRFLREARAAGRMSSHPHVVDLFDVGVTADQHPYLIMELCDGSYAERMRTSPLDAAEARDLGVKIADALAHSHRAGVLHRDVKPANILYSHFNSAVLADFGLAVLAEVRDPTLTLEVLTPAYAPPEMFRHAPPAPAVDVYALCATLYAVMQGRPPRWHNERDPSLVMLMEMFHQPVPDLPGVPPALLDVLRQGMANDPADRPSAIELRDLLTDVPVGRPTWSRAESTGGGGSGPHGSGGASGSGGGPGSNGSRPGATDRTGVVKPVRSARRPADDTVQIPSPRRPRWQLGLAVLGMIALLVAVGALSWYAGRHPGGTARRPTGDASDTALESPSAGGGPVPSSIHGAPPSATTARPGCRAGLPAGARCPTRPECFGPVRIRGTAAEAQPATCDGRHTWEVYALGDLPADVDPRNQDAVRAQAGSRVCTGTTFAKATGYDAASGWRFEVLPPDRAATEAGDRSYRCLAGRGVDGLTGQTLGR